MQAQPASDPTPAGLNLMGTTTSANLRYVFPGAFTVNSGAMLSLGAGVNVQINNGVTITDNGTLNVNGANTVVAQENNNCCSEGFVVNGSMNASGDAFSVTQAGAYTAQIVVNSGGHMTAANSTFSLTQLVLDNSSVLNSGDWTGDAFNLPIYVPYNDVQYLGGNAAFWGVVYAVNGQLSSGEVVVVHSNAKLVGAIDVDGRGTVGLGSSAPNLIYDPRAFNLLKTFSGAAPTPNTFRVLPSGQ